MNNMLYNSHRFQNSKDFRKLKGLSIIILTFVFLAFFEYSAAAQVRPTATLNNQGVVQLPIDKPISTHYEFDLSQHGFKTDAEMLEYLSTKSEVDYFVRANTETKKAILVLDRSQHPDWTIEQWNQHLQNKTSNKSFKK
jgi:hypothetical protein